MYARDLERRPECEIHKLLIAYKLKSNFAEEQ